ncbi:MAG: site-specific integrase [candidate division NC10 bacterium]|nr:site-specific integrase [candidate division NC10 bacterium]
METAKTGRTTKKKDKGAPRGLFRHRSGDWAIRFVCGQGHRHEEKIGRDKTQAKNEHAARRLRVRQHPGWCPRAERQEAQAAAQRQAAERVTLRAYAEKWLAANRPHWRPNTTDGYTAGLERHVLPTLGNVAMADVTREMVRGILTAKRAEGLKLNTINNRVIVPLRALFFAAMDDGIVAANSATRHMRHVRATTEAEARKVDFLTDEELSGLLKTADTEYPQHADFCHVLAWTGVREGEACGLQWGDLDFRGGFLEVRRNVIYRADPKQRGKKIKRPERTPLLYIGAPKSGESGRVDMAPRLASRLQARQDMMAAEAAVNGREPSPWVFPALGDPSKPLNIHTLENAWTRLLTRAGLRHLRIHGLRHTYASSLLQAGESIQYVKQQLRHSTIKLTVDLYGHLIPGKGRAAVTRLEERTSAPATPDPATADRGA